MTYQEALAAIVAHAADYIQDYGEHDENDEPTEEHCVELQKALDELEKGPRVLVGIEEDGSVWALSDGPTRGRVVTFGYECPADVELIGEVSPESFDASEQKTEQRIRESNEDDE